jgi:hypothetical protein
VLIVTEYVLIAKVAVKVLSAVIFESMALPVPDASPVQPTKVDESDGVAFTVKLEP